MIRPYISQTVHVQFLEYLKVSSGTMDEWRKNAGSKDQSRNCTSVSRLDLRPLPDPGKSLLALAGESG
jgi:hypothetical protein